MMEMQLREKELQLKKEQQEKDEKKQDTMMGKSQNVLLLC